MDTIKVIQSTQENWSIPGASSDSEILPSSLLAGIPFSCLSTTLIAAIHSLSTLTVGQHDRARSLLNTYHQARLREGNYSGKEQGTFAILQVSDVEKACESARKMNRVMELQGFVPSLEKGITRVDQRDCSTSQKISLPINLRTSKQQEQPEWDVRNSASNSTTDHAESDAQPDQTLAMHDFDMLTSTATTSTPYQDTEEDNLQTTPSHFMIAPSPTPHTRKRLVHLAPIETSHPPSPISGSSLPDVQSSFTPLFKHLKDEFSQAEATVAYLDEGLLEQQQQQQQGRMSVDVDVDLEVEARVLVMQRATHEFNVRRMEVQMRRREYEEARWRCEEARWRLERLRGG